MVNIQVTTGHSAPQTISLQNLGEKIPTKAVNTNQYQGADTTFNSEDVYKQQSQSSATLPGTPARKDSKAPAEKEGRATKNILKKFVADGMEQ